MSTQFDSVLPLFVEETFGWQATAAGLIFLPITLAAIVSPVSGWLVDKYGPRWPTVAGFIVLVPSQAALCFVTHNSLGQKALLCALLGLIGIGLAFALTPLLTEITSVVEFEEKKQPGIFGKTGAVAQAYGLFNFSWALGSMIGPIWAGFMKRNVNWTWMTLSFALLSFVTTFPIAFWTGGSILHDRRRR